MYDEPYAIELKDGSILGVLRSDNGAGMGLTHYTVLKTFSHDGGRTWSDPEPLDAEDVSGSPPHLLRHSSGAIICVVGRREQPYGERALVSHDEGQTWTEEYILDSRPHSADLG